MESIIKGKLKKNIYFKERDFYLLLGDSLELLEDFPDNCIDMIFADPPYFLSNGGIACKSGRMTSVDKGKWDKSSGIKESHEFNLKWLAQCQRILDRNELNGYQEHSI